jgi:DNA-binding IclR family transcriptional regulator
LSRISVLTMWGSNGPTVVRWEAGHLEAAIVTREGVNLSMVTTAAGQVFLAFMEADKIEHHLKRDLQDGTAGQSPASASRPPSCTNSKMTFVREG